MGTLHQLAIYSTAGAGGGTSKPGAVYQDTIHQTSVDKGTVHQLAIYHHSGVRSSRNDPVKQQITDWDTFHKGTLHQLAIYHSAGLGKSPNEAETLIKSGGFHKGTLYQLMIDKETVHTTDHHITTLKVVKQEEQLDSVRNEYTETIHHDNELVITSQGEMFKGVAGKQEQTYQGIPQQKMASKSKGSPLFRLCFW